MRTRIALLLVAATCQGDALAATSAELLPQLEAAEVAWAKSKPISYTYVFRYSAMFRYVGCENHFNVRVKAGSTDTNGKCDSLRGQFGSIPSLFAYIRAELRKNPDHVEARFNSEFGYPERFSVDPGRDVTDDEFTFELSAFDSPTSPPPPNNSLERSRDR